MDTNPIVAVLAILAAISGCCVFLVPVRSQNQLDETMNALSEAIKELSFWNFSTIERDIAFSWLKAIFRRGPNSLQFYINVAVYASIFTTISLSPYMVVPFSDPLNVSLVGYGGFFLMGFFIPNVIFSVISMSITVGLLEVGARIKNGLVYLFILAADGLIVSVLFSSLSVNLEFTRDYFHSLITGEIAANRWLAFYQPFLAIQYVAVHPNAIFESFRSEFYISAKYTTYILSITAMICAVFPLLVHTFVALFLITTSIFHSILKKLASFLLKRMNEQKTFKWLTWAFGLPVVCIKIWDSL